MKTRYSFFSIFFWIPMILWGQQIETHVNSGLQVINIKTIQGSVTVNLPEQIHADDVISGSVIAEANVQTDSKLSKKKQPKEGVTFVKSQLPIPIIEFPNTFMILKKEPISNALCKKVTTEAIMAHNIKKPEK